MRLVGLPNGGFLRLGSLVRYIVSVMKYRSGEANSCVIFHTRKISEYVCKGMILMFLVFDGYTGSGHTSP